MRFAEITIIVELGEDIETAEAESRLMDDVNNVLVDHSEFVTALRSIEVKDCTKECEAK